MIRAFLRLLLAAALLLEACASRMQPWLHEPLPNGQSFDWDLRAFHSNFLWVPVSDSLDIALLRNRCGVPAGHGMLGCYAEEDSSVHAQWQIAEASIASVMPLPRGEWIFGPGSAGARVHGVAAGRTLLIVHLPQGSFADTIRVVPAFDILRLEPRDSAYVAGDTTWFRVMGLDNARRQVASLPWPFSFGTQVGRPREDGAIPIVFEDIEVTHYSLPMMNVVATIGSKADTLHFRVLPRPAFTVGSRHK